MAVVLRNHALMYRPLRGGIGILNPEVAESGTLGLLATSDGTDRWILSCFHVLCHPTAELVTDRAPVFQPSRGAPHPVAHVVAARTHFPLDCAAALVEPGIDTVPEILGLGRVRDAVRPESGMAVVKSGLATGITEGVIRAVAGTRVEIAMRDKYPSSYDLSSAGDSGAVWLWQSTLQPVALHRGGTDVGEELAEAVDIVEVLSVLGLSVVEGT